jgi:chromate reductase, NAD(P)H dehydrogenase (quinone)
MDTLPKILAFAGSTRTDSFNKKLVRIAAAGAEAAGVKTTVIDLRDFPMPLYDGDLEAASGLPEHAVKLRGLLMEHDGLLIAAPEYNGSISAVLKNAIDWTSRPWNDRPMIEAYAGKTAAILSASPSPLGGLRGLVPLRMLLGNIMVTVLPNQFTVGGAMDAFDEHGNLKDAKTQAAAEGIGAVLASALLKLKK